MVALHAAVTLIEHTSGETGKTEEKVGEAETLPEALLDIDATSERERLSCTSYVVCHNGVSSLNHEQEASELKW